MQLVHGGGGGILNGMAQCLRSILCERVGLKAWDSFDATESSRQAMW